MIQTQIDSLLRSLRGAQVDDQAALVERLSKLLKELSHASA